jgi:tyrosine-protein phosphatase YwqE
MSVGNVVLDAGLVAFIASQDIHESHRLQSAQERPHECRFDARKLSDLLPAGMLTQVSHGENAGEQD